MHTITCSFQAEKLKKRQFYLLFFNSFEGEDRILMQANSAYKRAVFFLQLFSFSFKTLGIFRGFEDLGMCFFYYKYLRNQGRKRCKTNVNFQLYIVDRKQALRSKVSCRMEQFMKKRLNLFLLLLNTVEEKKVIFFLLSL